MANINIGAFRTIRLGGLVEITDVETTTTYDSLLGMEDGSLRIAPGMLNKILDYEKSKMKTTMRLGNENPTTFEVSVAVTGYTTDELFDLLTRDKKSSNDGTPRTFTVVVKQGTALDQTSGETLTFNHCVVQAGGVNIAEGENYDVLSAVFTSPTVRPALSTFGA